MNEWRLPTRDELLKAYEDKIKGFGEDYYWSSDTVEGDSNAAWVIYFNVGSDDWDYKSLDYHVRCVKGEKVLEWSKDIERMNWYDAQDYVKEMNTVKEYTVRVEIEISSIDLCNITVKAGSEEEAKKLAVKMWNDNSSEYDDDTWESEGRESSINMNSIDGWEVELK